MRLLVTGSRTWTDRSRMEMVLRLWYGEDVTLVHGNARGADRMAAEIAQGWGWKLEPYPASNFSWPTKRNTYMVSLGADACVAFPTADSRGTWDCLRKAEAAGIPIAHEELV